MTFPGWEDRLLHLLGITPSAHRRLFLRAWAKCEGGGARNNPLNTTYDLAPSTLYNHAGVKHYGTQVTGLCATALTLQLGYYTDLLAALGAPHLTAKSIATRGSRDLDKWGTGSTCIERLVG